jgi:CoA:oxalate CoA-transferase
VTRRWGKVFGGISGYFHAQNAGKKNISINFKHPEGVSLLRSLVKHADVLIENFRPGVMEKLGIDWETLKTDNPRLIMLSISGFGQTGPEARRAAYAPIIHAETGSIKRQAARHQRHRTGEGQHIDIAMVDAMLVTDDQTYTYLEHSRAATAASEVWDATGGPIMLAGDFRHLWRMASEINGLNDPTPEGADLDEKIRCRRAAYQDFLLSFPSRSELIDALNTANIAWGGVYDSGDFLEQSETLQHRSSIVEIDDRAGGTRPTFQSPYRFSDSKSGVSRGSARLGENNEAILQEWLNMDQNEISDLLGKGVIAADTDELA